MTEGMLLLVAKVSSCTRIDGSPVHGEVLGALLCSLEVKFITCVQAVDEWPKPRSRRRRKGGREGEGKRR